MKLGLRAKLLMPALGAVILCMGLASFMSARRAADELWSELLKASAQLSGNLSKGLNILVADLEGAVVLQAKNERLKTFLGDGGEASKQLAIAALKLGAESAEGVDIDPVAVRTAGENAARNGVAEKLTVLVGDLSDKASGKYQIVTANIVADAIKSLCTGVPALLAEGGVFIASGIIDDRRDEVVAAVRAAGFGKIDVREKRGWACLVCRI